MNQIEFAIKVLEKIKKNPSIHTGTLANELNTRESLIVEVLPPEMATPVPKLSFDKIIEEISTWGPITLIVQNESMILEVKGGFPMGKYGNGYFNLHTQASPIGGHIRASQVDKIFFVKKPFMKLDTYSIQFFNTNGNAMFKVYLGRNEKREIDTVQLAKYNELLSRLKNNKPNSVEANIL